ncbi:MAG: hypothetical protein KF687_16400 [Cyclobacteriaceae bacterium]|nr:hypothetical protein [Cyclobacteriaceae bacterium]
MKTANIGQDILVWTFIVSLFVALTVFSINFIRAITPTTTSMVISIDSQKLND